MPASTLQTRVSFILVSATNLFLTALMIGLHLLSFLEPGFSIDPQLPKLLRFSSSRSFYPIVLSLGVESLEFCDSLFNSWQTSVRFQLRIIGLPFPSLIVFSCAASDLIFFSAWCCTGNALTLAHKFGGLPDEICDPFHYSSCICCCNFWSHLALYFIFRWRALLWHHLLSWYWDCLLQSETSRTWSACVELRFQAVTCMYEE